jgi:hypothetical protein
MAGGSNRRPVRAGDCSVGGCDARCQGDMDLQRLARMRTDQRECLRSEVGAGPRWSWCPGAGLLASWHARARPVSFAIGVMIGVSLTFNQENRGG